MEDYVYIDLMRNKKFLHYFKLYSSIFVFSFIISIIICLEYTNVSNGAMYILKNYTPLGNGNFDMISILANNFLISIAFLYYLSSKESRFKNFLSKFFFLKMGLIGGLLISTVIIKYNLVVALSMIVPHGIIEIPTIIYAFSIGWVLLELKENRQSKMRKEFIYISGIIFILLSISAYVEVYVTPNICEMLLSYYY